MGVQQQTYIPMFFKIFPSNVNIVKP